MDLSKDGLFKANVTAHRKGSGKNIEIMFSGSFAGLERNWFLAVFSKYNITTVNDEVTLLKAMGEGLEATRVVLGKLVSDPEAMKNLKEIISSKKLIDEFLRLLTEARKINGLGQFEVGHEPYNKGITRVSTSPETEFKEGHKPHNFKGIGVDHKPYTKRRELMTCTEETEERVSRGRKYVTKKRTSKARYLWERSNGKIPKGMVIHNTGDWDDPQLENLKLITRAELMKINSGR